MKWIVALSSLLLVGLILLDAFEALVQPRRVTHRFRPARLFFRSSWAAWGVASRRFRVTRRREAFLSLYGPLSLLTLFSLWAATLVVGFALLHWAFATPLAQTGAAPSLLSLFYLSGVTFFTLGYGDLTPLDTLGRVLAVLEAGIGFGFMAVIIGYLPTLSQAFSQREVSIGLLDARAGSPPTAGELFRRLPPASTGEMARSFLAEWERWSAQLLESHLSFPILSYYRSQHDNQSWLAALATILDTCALMMSGLRSGDTYQAQLTFAMARHTTVDLAMVFWVPPEVPPEDRLPDDSLVQVLQKLVDSGFDVHEPATVEKKLAELRQMYEPFLYGLSRRFLFALPPIATEKVAIDNWQTSAWMKRLPGFEKLPVASDEHFH